MFVSILQQIYTQYIYISHSAITNRFKYKNRFKTRFDSVAVPRRSARRKSARATEIVAGGGAALAGPQQHGALWRMISDLLVTRLGTCMLVRSLVLENRCVVSSQGL